MPTARYNEAIMEAAAGHMGLEEWPGARHNPRIVQMFEDVGHGWVQDDETPWCAAFVGSVLTQLGLPHTGKLNARSYLDWGEAVELPQAQPGDVVILWRNSPSSWQGHVGFFVSFDDGRVVLRGGNQGNRVSDQGYPMSRVLGVRRATGAAPGDNRPVLRNGARGQFVRDLQGQLKELGYALGRVDGSFGPRTEEAVLAFQAENDLERDGIVGRQTWKALETAQPRPEREVSADDLRKEGSRTMRSADNAQAGAGLSVLLGGGTLGLERLEEGLSAFERAEGVIERATGLLAGFWPVIAVAVIGFVLWHFLGEIKRARLDDARRGRNIGR